MSELHSIEESPRIAHSSSITTNQVLVCIFQTSFGIVYNAKFLSEKKIKMFFIFIDFKNLRLKIITLLKCYLARKEAFLYQMEKSNSSLRSSQRIH